MKCQKCEGNLRKVEVKVTGAESKAVSYQCPNCDYFTFEPKSAVNVVREIKERESPLKMKQSIIKLSKDRLGIYFNKDIIRSLDLKSGEEVKVIVGNETNTENALFWKKKDYVWTKTGDSLFLRDSKGKLVLWKSY